MIDERFSAGAFEMFGRNTAESEALAQALAEEIAQECLADLRAAGQKIADSLRRLGHHVQESGIEPYGGAFTLTFVDASEGEEPERHRLRFNLDLVVSTGYPGYKDVETD